jgi:nitrogen fixation protein FixH
LTKTEPTTDASASEFRHRLFWVGLIFALLGGQIALLLFMTYLATADASFSVEPDYYEKGLNWDETAIQLRQNERLGWSLNLEVAGDADEFGKRVVACTLRDGEGRPLDGATVDVVAFAHARGSQRTAFALLGVGGGRYEGQARFRRAGLWEFRFVIQRGPETFTHTQNRRLDPPGDSRS